jgi:DNA-binding Lrp family transcriptional regulator
VDAWACIGVEVRGSVHEVASKIAALPGIPMVMITSGRHDLLLFAASASRDELVTTILGEIRAIAGVRGTETWGIVKIKRLEFNLARFL